ncbi:hypothetical protein [Aliivibrio fischeri]|uniref:hypothetical protein n=1 Tax=Aliivibrio fischeri TaxID=668 RepID=UPI0012DA2240|nr:hypothetical protein [Aliivibrio fischeri]MUK70324.1 hypothetical protein [Aliivibrio fischeri]MUK72012.1 hypothetical protein [Aliivibrio fischeri]
MKTIIGISNFSFDTFHFSSFSDLENQFAKFQLLKADYNQDKVSIAVANDITKDKWFGLSIDEQLQNFEFGKDKGVITYLALRLDRTHLVGFNRSFTSVDLKNKAQSEPCIVEKENTILYAPNVLIGGYANFKDKISFDKHYEYILGHFPIDNKSYYHRAKSHFTNLIYHVDCESTLDKVPDGFVNYSIAITKCLKALNEHNPTQSLSLVGRLSEIRSSASYNCTPQGGSHKHFKFAFNYKGTQYPNLDCQFHLKPSDKNIKGDGSHNHKRVYFGFIPINSIEWKIAVAAIGPHITIHDSSDRYAPEKIRRKKKRRKGNS